MLLNLKQVWNLIPVPFLLLCLWTSGYKNSRKNASSHIFTRIRRDKCALSDHRSHLSASGTCIPSITLSRSRISLSSTTHFLGKGKSYSLNQASPKLISSSKVPFSPWNKSVSNWWVKAGVLPQKRLMKFNFFRCWDVMRVFLIPHCLYIPWFFTLIFFLQRQSPLPSPSTVGCAL